MAAIDGQSGSGTGQGRRPFGGRSIATLLADVSSSPGRDLAVVRERLRPGVVVDGRFEIVRRLGRGGVGEVHEARDLTLGRRVAFKVVPKSADRRAARVARLLREAAAAARLSHPHIVQLHDVGQSECGPYLVLELLLGETLDHRLDEAGALPVLEALHVARDVAAALAHAHAAGVVHRDLKPDNVFLLEDGHSKVLDFDLARASGLRSPGGGTPGYMAPEQWRGAPEDERTDVFALGVLIFQMLAGELPFPGVKGARDLGAAPDLELPELPRLGWLLRRMLAHDPVDRPRDAAEVLREIDEMVGAAPAVPVRPAIRRQRARRRLDLRGVAYLLAALLVGAGLGYFLAGR